MAGNIDLTKLKWIKNVRHQEPSKTFQKYWNQGHGGLSGFQEHIRQVLKLN